MDKILIRNKTLTIPLIQGGMGIGVSLGNLAGHVMKEGGMGVISAAQPGYLEYDFRTNTIEANIRALKKEIIKAREISSGNGLLGVNLMVAAEHYDVYAKEISQMDIDVIISGAGLPLELPTLSLNQDILLAPIVSSSKAMILLVKRWLSRANRFPDLIIIEGPLAGGHLGFSWDQLNHQSYPSLESILNDVLIALDENKWNIPVFVAGGIYTKEDIQKFLDLGATGVQMATRFITTYECDADIKFKEAFINAKESDIRYVISPSGYPGRAIDNKLVTTLMNQEKVKVKHCYNCLKPCNPATTPYCITEALIQAVKGNIDEGLVFTGVNGYRNKIIVHVSELINELFPKKESIL